MYALTYPLGSAPYVHAYKGQCMLLAEQPQEVDLEHQQLVAFCRGWLKFRGEGEDYYRNSLVPATSYDPMKMFSGSLPDRRMGIAVQEADLTRAMMSLTKLQRDCAVLSRSDGRDRGWTRRWSQLLWQWNKEEWLDYQDQIMDPTDKRPHAIRLGKVINTLLFEAAEGMATFLGPNWR